MTQSTNSKFDTIEALRERAEKAEAENAALREPIPAENAMRIVLEWYDSDKSGVELIRRAEAWKNAPWIRRTK